MNKHIRQFSILSAAVLITGAMFAYWPAGTGSPAEAQSRSTPQANFMSNSAPPREPIKDDFVPEFRGLPDFGEIEYIASKGKLIDLLGNGIYRRSEVVAKNGEGWLVFVKGAAGYSIQRSAATVNNLDSVSWPGDEKDAQLTFKVTGVPVFAVRNISSLNAGSINTLFQHGIWEDYDAESQELATGYRRTFNIGSSEYVLRVSRGTTTDGTRVAVLVLESRGTAQVLNYTYHDPNADRDIIGSLLWVGDMDRDGKLDLYFDEFNEKGATATGLYLSGQAGTGQLVGLAADFHLSGC